MTTVFQQAAPATATVAPKQSELAMRVTALERQQEMLVNRVVGYETELSSAERALKRASAAERPRARAELHRMESSLQDTRNQLLEVRNKLNQLVAAPAVPSVPAPPVVAAAPAPAGIATLPPVERTFGFTRRELNVMLEFPLVILMGLAFVRMIWRRGSTMGRVAPNPESDARLERLEQAVDSVAIEVERIGESQRFVTKILTERAPERVEREVREPLSSRRVATPIP